MVKLEERYNEPLVVNYNLLDRMFNNPAMAKPQSTQEHWDNAVGDINAVIASGMTIAEILVYYKLHKFPPETVKKVKMLHKIQFPGRPCINLNEAIKLMNEVTADEVELTKDSEAIEQTMQGLTMTAVPRFSQATTQATTPKAQPQNTFKQQNEGKSYSPYKRNKNRWTTNNNKNKYKCLYCDTTIHLSKDCPRT